MKFITTHLNPRSSHFTIHVWSITENRVVISHLQFLTIIRACAHLSSGISSTRTFSHPSTTSTPHLLFPHHCSPIHTPHTPSKHHIHKFSPFVQILLFSQICYNPMQSLPPFLPLLSSPLQLSINHTVIITRHKRNS